ncbi:ribonuclease E inhibitor RraB [Chitinimonas viridis]|uniref:Ribonuclease E inhibitor RraB n=1 Tax=Chitinimonas viridis TaxID=664880 RepID=A0ABT8B681_9NEIS|nr:ribonuclease E inhibitor RraB [Chitinimonas viridis]MDN3577126.1 ribonuclease E inhibitor RraB [Chitinimonas viridis]
MLRNNQAFPDDENGDVLWRMHQQGDNLTKAREIDFSVIFSNKEMALKFAVHLLCNNQKVSFSPYEEHETMPWQVQAHPILTPTHENIGHYEEWLAQSAAALGGCNDEWGCFAQQ